MFSAELSTRERDGHAGDDLLLAAPQQPVLRVLALTRWPHTIVRSGTPSAGAEHGSQQQTGEAEASPLPRSHAAEPMTVEDGPASESAARNMAKGDPATVVPFPGHGDDR